MTCFELYIHEYYDFVGFDMHESAVDFDGFFVAGDGLDGEVARYKHAEKVAVTRQDVERASVVHGTHRVGIALKVDLKRCIHLDCHSWFAMLVGH